MGSKDRPYNHKATDLSSGFGIGYLERLNSEVPKLRGIYDGAIPYSYGDFPRLIECFEMLYKGTYLKAKEIWPENFVKTKQELKLGHHFSPYAVKIDSKIPLSDSYDGRNAVVDGLSEYENSYNEARFDVNYELEDFRKAYRRLDYQIARMYEGLKKEVIRITEEANDSKDLENW